MPSNAEDYLASALEIMERNALYRDEVQWSIVRAEAFRRAVGASSPPQTYDAIRWALAQLKDDHSFFAPPDRRFDDEGVTAPNGDMRADQIAYLHVPGFRGSPQLAIRYADLLQQIIELLDDSDPVGWMVDLTDNWGGNMWPMLAGLGPLLGEGRLGSFRFPTQPPATWSYRAGRAALDDVSLAKTSDGGYSLRHPAKPVALLSSRRTASSGEAVLVAFVGRPCTYRFGTTTRGLTTTNDDFPLPDGATLFLTVGVFADRLGRVYGQAMDPDRFCDEADDQIQMRAAEWIPAANKG
jgi:carboxyl-terminal processing protease